MGRTLERARNVPAFICTCITDRVTRKGIVTHEVAIPDPECPTHSTYPTIGMPQPKVRKLRVRDKKLFWTVILGSLTFVAIMTVLLVWWLRGNWTVH